jgi:hypothetical protein
MDRPPISPLRSPWRFSAPKAENPKFWSVSSSQGPDVRFDEGVGESGELLNTVTTSECANYFASSGFVIT